MERRKMEGREERAEEKREGIIKRNENRKKRLEGLEIHHFI